MVPGGAPPSLEQIELLHETRLVVIALIAVLSVLICLLTLGLQHSAEETARAALAEARMSEIIENFTDTLFSFTPDGVIYKYDKAHLFSLAEENIYFTKGKEIVTIPYLGWNIRPYICYDIRFPVFNRNRINNNSFDYDVLVYVSNWPTKRYNHWKHLLIARAIENQTYVIGVNRVGTDGNGFEYMGGTMCIDPVGNVILEGTQDENVYFVKTNYDNLVKIRQKLPFSKDWDDFDIK